MIDTSYLIALETADDQYHTQARDHWQTLITALPPLVVTSYVMDEVVTFFNSRDRHAKAVEVGNRLLQSSLIQFIHVEPSLFYQSWNYFVQRSDKSYSLTDCISFLVMQQLGIQTALTFDQHFTQAGFLKLP